MAADGNKQLRAHREATASPTRPGSPMSRAELAEAVNAHIWAVYRKRVCLDADTVGRYERGVIRWPSADYRAGLRAVLGAGSDGDLGFYPTRRGVSAVPRAPQRLDDGIVPTDAEEQASPVDRRDFLRTMGAVGAAAVVSAEPFASAGGTSRHGGHDAIRRTLLAYPTADAPVSLASLAVRAEGAHAAYQAGRYGTLVHILPDMISAAAAVGNTAREQAVRSQTLLVAAKMLTKVGDAQLAHIAADRALQAAFQSGEPVLAAGAAYQVSCAVLSTHGADQAQEVSEAAFAAARSNGPTDISYKGALALISAVAAARSGDAREAGSWLARAQGLAGDLGTDANFGWTAFGPTNVRIHQVSVAVELDRPDQAIELATTVDTDLLPEGLHSRRGQVHIDSAWAYAQKNRDPEAVISLLEAERHAPETVRHSESARALVLEMVERRGTTPGLRALARRIGVAA